MGGASGIGSWDEMQSLNIQRLQRLRPRSSPDSAYRCNHSENSPNLEEEFGVAVIAHSTADFDRPKYCIYNQRAGHIPWKLVGRLISLANLKHAEGVNCAAQKRRQVLQFSKVSSLKQEVLVGQQFIGAESDEAGYAAKIEQGYARLVAIAGSSVSIQKHRSRTAQPEKVLKLQLR